MTGFHRIRSSGKLEMNFHPEMNRQLQETTGLGVEERRDNASREKTALESISVDVADLLV